MSKNDMEDHVLYSFGHEIDNADKKKKENNDNKTTRPPSMITWDKIFFSVYSCIKDELKGVENISDKEADEELTELKNLLMSKVLIFTRLLPIHARNKVRMLSIGVASRQFERVK